MVHMHPELNAIVARQRFDELSSAGRRTIDLTPRLGVFRRRRGVHRSRVVAPAPIVLLPPPREELDTTGHDQRVA